MRTLPQARQWCLVRKSENCSPHSWHMVAASARTSRGATRPRFATVSGPSLSACVRTAHHSRHNSCTNLYNSPALFTERTVRCPVRRCACVFRKSVIASKYESFHFSFSASSLSERSFIFSTFEIPTTRMYEKLST